MPAPLTTLSRLRALAPDLPATVQVRNLHATLRRAGHDAWGRARKPQPCLVSAEVGFTAPFGFAAARDALGADTVHYGALSKAVLASLAAADADSDATGREEGENRKEEEEEEEEEDRTVRDVLARLWRDLTGLELDGEPAFAGGEADGQAQGQGKVAKGEPLLDLGRVRFLSVTLALPKASLLGEAVSLTAAAVFDAAAGTASGSPWRVEARALALEVSRLRVPTLIGVNANERLAKQFVVATLTVERYDRREDAYTDVEAVVVKALEESSFETLEALGARLAERVLATPLHQDSWQVCVRMEKPTAVPLADCPIVEVRATK